VNGVLAAIFLGFVGAHLVHALFVVTGRTPGRIKYVAMFTQTPIFVIACIYGVRQGVFSRELLSPLYIAGGLVGGHIIFAFSLLLIHRSWEHAADYFKEYGELWSFVTASPVVLSRFLVVAVSEEIMYRVGLQYVLLGLLVPIAGNIWGSVASISITAVLFAIVHDHFFRNSLAISAEFLVFSFLLGLLYYFTQSLMLVIVVHAVRDIEVAYLEYLLKMDELGDSEKALDAIEQQYLIGRPKHA